MVAREGRCERVRRVVAREGRQSKRNLGLARAREKRKSVVYDGSWLFRRRLFVQEAKLPSICAPPVANFRDFGAFKN